MRRSLDLRCEGQGFSVTVPLSEDWPLDEALAEALGARFAEIYKTVYGHPPPGVPLEVINLRARVESPRADVRLRGGTAGLEADQPALKGHRPVHFDAAGGYVETAIFDRYRLVPNKLIPGPAVIEERETSIVVGPDAEFHVDADANLIIDIAK